MRSARALRVTGSSRPCHPARTATRVPCAAVRGTAGGRLRARGGCRQRGVDAASPPALDPAARTSPPIVAVPVVGLAAGADPAVALAVAAGGCGAGAGRVRRPAARPVAEGGPRRPARQRLAARRAARDRRRGGRPARQLVLAHRRAPADRRRGRLVVAARRRRRRRACSAGAGRSARTSSSRRPRRSGCAAPGGRSSSVCSSRRAIRSSTGCPRRVVLSTLNGTAAVDPRGVGPRDGRPARAQHVHDRRPATSTSSPAPPCRSAGSTSSSRRPSRSTSPSAGASPAACPAPGTATCRSARRTA